MEPSASHKKVIELGNELVELLKLESRGDTLARWMAYYLAEQLTLAETTRGAEKVAAEKRCFKTVLSLWKQRSDWPSGIRPLGEFEPILTTLARLNPDTPQPFFHRPFRSNDDQIEEEKAAVLQLMNFVESFDIAARALIEAALESAVQKAASETTRRLIQKALPAKPELDIEIVRRLLGERNAEPEEISDARAKQLEKRVEQLRTFEQLCKEVRSGYTAELKTLRIVQEQ